MEWLKFPLLERNLLAIQTLQAMENLPPSNQPVLLITSAIKKINESEIKKKNLIFIFNSCSFNFQLLFLVMILSKVNEHFPIPALYTR